MSRPFTLENKVRSLMCCVLTYVRHGQLEVGKGFITDDNDIFI